MILSDGNADDLDSNCSRRLPAGDAPDAVAPRCKREATTWIVSPKGTRRYLCEDHAREVLRFRADSDEDTAEDDLDDHPPAAPCHDCTKMTLLSDLGTPSRKCPDCETPGGGGTQTRVRTPEQDGLP